MKNSKPHAKEGKNIKPQLLRISGEKEFNVQVHQKILNLARNSGRISGIIVVENLE